MKPVLLVMASSGLFGLGVALLLAQEAVTPPQVLPPTFFIQDQNKWSCILEGDGIPEGKLPLRIRCTHSKTGEVVIYLPQPATKAEQKKEVKK